MLPFQYKHAMLPLCISCFRSLLVCSRFAKERVLCLHKEHVVIARRGDVLDLKFILRGNFYMRLVCICHILQVVIRINTRVCILYIYKIYSTVFLSYCVVACFVASTLQSTEQCTFERMQSNRYNVPHKEQDALYNRKCLLYSKRLA